MAFKDSILYLWRRLSAEFSKISGFNRRPACNGTSCRKTNTSNFIWNPNMRLVLVLFFEGANHDVLCSPRQDNLHSQHMSRGLPIAISFSFLKFYWSIVELQCCDNFCCITKWFSYAYTCIHSFSDSFPI